MPYKAQREEILEVLKNRRDMYREFEEGLSEGGQHADNPGAEKRRAMCAKTAQELDYIIDLIQSYVSTCPVCGEEFEKGHQLSGHMSKHGKAERRKALRETSLENFSDKTGRGENQQ